MPNSDIKKELAARLKSKKTILMDWFQSLPNSDSIPYYSSMDLRDAGFKIAPVDDNFFPAGFNNICPEDLRTAPPILRRQMLARAHSIIGREPHRILILPESNTENRFYIENLYYLQDLMTRAGFDVRIGWFNSERDLISQSEKTLHAHSIRLQSGRLMVEGFDPDVILVNNDFSAGYPPELDQCEQVIIPSHKMGWHSRRKDTFFSHYNHLVAELATQLDLDAWRLQVRTEAIDQVDFNEEVGIDRVADAVDRVLSATLKEYRDRKIEQQPFAFVKNNAGTYGMGIMVVHSAEELRAMNRRTKNKMSVGKNRSMITSVIVQEGIPTALKIDGLAAEPVIYMCGCDWIGGFLRSNTQRGTEENLNSQGMVFRKLCMSDLRTALEDPNEEEPTLELVYGTIARVAAQAAGREMRERMSKR